nr:hypothetical protein [Chitinophagaceae bacterium]
MKQKLLVIALAICSLSACKKKTETPPANTPNATASFTWTENGGAVITADSAYWTTGAWGTGIRAFKGAGFSNYFEINWAGADNTSIGAKTLAVGTDFTFLKAADTYTNPTPQTLNVTGFSNNTLSGNATVAVTGGSITSLVCTFSNLPKK